MFSLKKKHIMCHKSTDNMLFRLVNRYIRPDDCVLFDGHPPLCHVTKSAICTLPSGGETPSTS